MSSNRVLRALHTALALCILTAGLLFASQAGAEERTAGAAVKAGDIVKVNYTARLEDGSLIATTLSTVAQEKGAKKVATYKDPVAFGPVEIVAGEPDAEPGVGRSVMGMVVGEKKKVTVPAADAYGPTDPKKTMVFPLTKVLPKRMPMPPDKFYEQFGAFPIKGKEVEFAPFLKARVDDVSENMAVVNLLAKDGEEFKETYGTIVTRVDEKNVSIVLTPQIGAAFKMGGSEGVVLSKDEKTFTVDFNPPMAGKPIALDLEVVSRVSVPGSMNISWTEQHDEGLSVARKEGKPAMLVLYADWCPWCKKLFTETMQDPRIRLFADRVIWIKVNSDINKEIAAKYRQKDFPLIVFLGKDGSVLRENSGFMDVDSLRKVLEPMTGFSQAK